MKQLKDLSTHIAKDHQHEGIFSEYLVLHYLESSIFKCPSVFSDSFLLITFVFLPVQFCQHVCLPFVSLSQLSRIASKVHL